MRFPVLQQRLDHFLKEIWTALHLRRQQHEEKPKPFDVLSVADAELGA
jgi:hypothetical protein